MSTESGEIRELKKLVLNRLDSFRKTIDKLATKIDEANTKSKNCEHLMNLLLNEMIEVECAFKETKTNITNMKEIVRNVKRTEIETVKIEKSFVNDEQAMKVLDSTIADLSNGNCRISLNTDDEWGGKFDIKNTDEFRVEVKESRDFYYFTVCKYDTTFFLKQE